MCSGGRKFLQNRYKHTFYNSLDKNVRKISNNFYVNFRREFSNKSFDFRNPMDAYPSKAYLEKVLFPYNSVELTFMKM